jgi:hypothetical protein
MATLANEQAQLELEDAVEKEQLFAEVLAKARKEEDAGLLKVCECVNSRELNKCNAETIRVWAKAAVMKGLSRLGKPALIRQVSLFRGFMDAVELVSDTVYVYISDDLSVENHERAEFVILQEAQAVTKDVSAPLRAPVVQSDSHPLFPATEEADDPPIASPTAFEAEKEWRTRRGDDEQLLDDLPPDTRREALQIVGGLDDEEEDEDEDEDEDGIDGEIDREEDVTNGRLLS